MFSSPSPEQETTIPDALQWQIQWEELHEPNSIKVSLYPNYGFQDNEWLEGFNIEARENDNFYLCLTWTSDPEQDAIMLNRHKALLQRLALELQLIPLANKHWPEPLRIRLLAPREKFLHMIQMLSDETIIPASCNDEVSTILLESAIWLPALMRALPLLAQATVNYLQSSVDKSEAEFFEKDEQYRNTFQQLIDSAIDQDLLYFFALRKDKEFKNKDAYQYAMNLALTKNKVAIQNILNSEIIDLTFVADYLRMEKGYQDYFIAEKKNKQLAEEASIVINSLWTNPTDNEAIKKLVACARQLTDPEAIAGKICQKLRSDYNFQALNCTKEQYQKLLAKLNAAKSILTILTDNSLPTSNRHWGSIDSVIQHQMLQIQNATSLVPQGTDTRSFLDASGFYANRKLPDDSSGLAENSGLRQKL